MESLVKPNYRQAEREAIRLLNEAGIIDPPVNPVHIANLVGVNVRFVAFQGASEGVAGLFDPVQNAILVNQAESGVRQTFTIAHELGHKVMHEEWANSQAYKVLWRDPSRRPNDRWEREANTFAANLLMPKEMFEKYKSYPISMVARIFAVSEEAAGYRRQYLDGL
ncbi:MAG TPA: ImmA/IrrE family metallo-endopeptidase [Terracidiphilus sp.]|nr:ImmA/IrrE family metallo-endopeptidase [Terracidiphilus sp.]